MKDFWPVFKEGAIDGVATFGAIAVLLFMVVWALVIIVGLQVVLLIGWIFRQELTTYNAITELNLNVDDFLVSVTDSYQVWYDKIATTLKNLVK